MIDNVNREILSNLVSFIREEISEYKMTIILSTQIEDDLGVTGMEAAELITKFAEHFNVDIRAFNFDDYFHPEPGMFIYPRQIKILTVGDLQDAINLGKLE